MAALLPPQQRLATSAEAADEQVRVLADEGARGQHTHLYGAGPGLQQGAIRSLSSTLTPSRSLMRILCVVCSTSPTSAEAADEQVHALVDEGA